MGQLADTVGGLASPEDKNGPQSIAEGFDSASKSLEKNLLRSPEDMAKTASTIGEHFRGGDEKTGGHRMEAFKKSSDMMGESQSVDHSSINQMLTQASQRDPKIQNGEGPDRAKRLGKVMEDVSTGVKQGTVSANDLSSHFRNQDAERARFQPQPDKKIEKKQDEQGRTEENKANEQGRTGESKPGDQGRSTDTKVSASEQSGTEKTAPREALTASQKEEQESAGSPSLPGQGPATTEGTKEAAKLGPGEAAGTKEAGVQPGTNKTPGVPSATPDTSQTGLPQLGKKK